MYALTPTEFENYVAWLYVQQGFITKVTPPQKDGGIDIFLYKTLADLTPWGAVQVKRYATHNQVSRDELEKFYGAYHDKVKNGILVTTSTFSDWTQERARKLGVTLVDGEALVRMAQRYGVPSYMKESL
jgi:restriction endonuclease Mrr